MLPLLFAPPTGGHSFAMLPFSAAQLALNQLLCQRLREARCHLGRLDVSAPGTYLSLSGQKPDGGTLFFWEFGQHFHQVVADYLRESYTEHTAQLTVQVDVTKAEFSYSHLTQQQQAAQEAATRQQASERRPGVEFPPPGRPRARQG